MKDSQRTRLQGVTDTALPLGLKTSLHRQTRDQF